MDLTAFITTIRGWTNDEDVDDVVVTSWVRMAEERMNHELRHKDMIERATATLSDNSADLPPDWLELIYVRYSTVPASDNANLRKGRPLEFVTNDEYWDRCSPDHAQANTPSYTIIGNVILVVPGVSPEGTEIEIGYFAELTPLEVEVDNPFVEKYPRLYTFATLALSAPYLVEDERTMVWETEATRLISMMNTASKSARFSGSPLRMRNKGFG